MYHFNLNDISIDKLVNDYKTNDRKSYIKYDQLDKKEQKEYSIKVFDFFNKTQTFKSLDTNKILLSNSSNEIEISNEKINQKILNTSIENKLEIKNTKNDFKKLENVNKRQENTIKVNTEIKNKEKLDTYIKPNCNKNLKLSEFLNNELSYGLKDSNNVPIDIRLKEYLCFPRGFFIDVGAHDGVSQNNTKIFEELYGWKGLLIEPSTKCIDKIKINRPGAIIENCALVGDDRKQISGDFNGHLMASENGKRLNKKNNNCKFFLG